jgi:hypothetical protein
MKKEHEKKRQTKKEQWSAHLNVPPDMKVMSAPYLLRTMSHAVLPSTHSCFRTTSVRASRGRDVYPTTLPNRAITCAREDSVIRCVVEEIENTHTHMINHNHNINEDALPLLPVALWLWLWLWQLFKAEKTNTPTHTHTYTFIHTHTHMQRTSS